MIDHFVEAYSKLLIGIVSLTAPITSYLLANYIVNRAKILKNLSEQHSTSNRINVELNKQMADAVNKGLNATDFIKQCNLQMEENDV